MIIGNDELYVRGNTVLKPERVQIEKENNDKYEKLEKQKNQLKLKKEKEAKVHKAKIISLIFISFLIGFTVLYRYSLIYSIQKDYVEARQSVGTLAKENENLKINLVKLEDDKTIRDKISSLKMAVASKNVCASVDLNKDVFNAKKENKTEEGVLSYIKQLFF